MMNLKSLTRSDRVWQTTLLFFALMLAWSGVKDHEVFLAGLTGESGPVSPLAWQIDSLGRIPWLSALIRFCLVGLNLFLIYTMVRRYELIDSLSIFPIFFYILFSACYSPAYSANSALVASVLTEVACINLFDCYQTNNCRIQVFNVFFFTSLAALLMPALLLILPLLWLSFNWINTLTFNRFIASLTGILTVAWLIGGLCFLTGQWPLLLDCLRRLPDYFDFQTRTSWQEILFLSVCLLVFIVAVLYRLNKFYSEKNSVRGYLSFLVFTWFVLIVMSLLFSPLKHECLTLSVMPWCIMTGHFFDANDNWASRLLLLLLFSTGFFFFFSRFLI
ncbi:MAG: hypothetical protein IJ154_09615 [Bacteroidales bacterium]|nr:hypothetical protein [Bacteroidales bacterium]MBQ9202603.1 hypothetical protein [Bacteroidales bacterium]